MTKLKTPLVEKKKKSVVKKSKEVITKKKKPESEDEIESDQSEEMALDDIEETDEMAVDETEVMEGKNGQEEGKKPDWKSIKLQNKGLKLQRKKSNCSFFDMTMKAKKIWEKLRRNDCPVEKKKVLAAEIHKLFQGNYPQIVRPHDMSRIVEWVIRFGKGEINSQIVEELKSHFLNMVQQKYASFCIKELLEHGGARNVIDAVINSFVGHTVKLLRNNYSWNIVANAYKKHANAEQKCLMKQDLYGDVFKMFKGKNLKSLSEAVESDAAMKPALLNSAYSTVIALVTKGRAQVEPVHSVAKELFTLLEESSNEQKELKTQLQGHLQELSTSRDGAWVTMFCLWNSSAKERKEMMKMCKEHLNSIMLQEFGHFTVMAMVDCVDDTVLLSKIILEPIIENALEYSRNEHSMKVLQYLTVHRDTQYFHPVTIKMMEQGDGNTFSKKPMETRRSEILNYVSKRLLEKLFLNPKEWLKTNNSCMVIRCILKSATGDSLGDAYKQLAGLITDKQFMLETQDSSISAVEDMGVHKMLRMLIAHDKIRYEHNEQDHLLSNYIIEELKPEVKWWLDINRGAFILVCMLDLAIPHIQKEVFKFLKPLEESMGTITAAGTKVLLKKLKENKKLK